jgi:hypothetical protein
MIEDEVTANIAQLQKVYEIAERGQPLTDEESLEFEKALVMSESMVSHRGPDFKITPEQALELVTVMRNIGNLREKLGIPEIPFEELLARTERFMKLKPQMKS